MTDDRVNYERRRELGRFLRNRRSRIRPHDVGLPPGPGHRRVAGLRREEVASLAGVGVTWYTMLENGAADGVSAATLDAVARALRLTRDETKYLHDLVDPGVYGPPDDRIGPLARGALAAIEWVPAYVCTSQWIVPAWNRAMSLVWGIEPPGGASFNIVRRMFVDARMRALHGDAFPAFARNLVAMVRAGAGRRIDDPVYLALCEELRHDAVFAAAWDDYDVAAPLGSVRTRVMSAAIGAFEYEPLTLVVPDANGHSIVIQIPDEPGANRLRAALAGDAIGRNA